MRFSQFARYYTPIVCLLALVALNFLSQQVSFDPLTAAQNSRLEFQTDQVTNQHNTLSITETQLAEAALTPDFGANLAVSNILYVGNSQSMAIMDRLPGDLTTPQWLQILLLRAAVADQLTFLWGG